MSSGSFFYLMIGQANIIMTHQQKPLKLQFIRNFHDLLFL